MAPRRKDRHLGTPTSPGPWMTTDDDDEWDWKMLGELEMMGENDGT